MKRKLPNVMDNLVLIKLFDNISEPVVMIACLLATFCGLRKSEVINLHKSDVNLNKMQLKIIDAKNPKRSKEGYGKDRCATLPEILREPIKLWLEIIGDAKYLLPSTVRLDEPINDKHLFRKYKAVLAQAGLMEKDCTLKNGKIRCRFNFHTLRHSYATILLEKTGNIEIVRKALGHSDIKTTMIYTHLSDKVLNEKINETFGRTLYKPSTIRDQQQIELKNDAEVLKPLEIVKARFAAGDIGLDEYRAIVNELNSSLFTHSG